jgi:putative heme-binding domain-containing protein
VKCHRYGKQGEAIGPDLSTVSQRFQKREILESILFPSHTISDQYSSKTVTTSNGLSFTGIVGALADGTVVVLQPNGQKTTIRKGDIEQIVPSPKSAMPEGLLDSLTLEDIADLFAYLGGTVR